MAEPTEISSDMDAILNRIPRGWGQYASVSKGWNDLVLKLDGELAKIDPNYIIHQVKEKFGGLRYYAQPSQEAWEAMSVENRQKFQDLIAAAESESTRTCETCGKPGIPCIEGAWHVTACEEHSE